jgi:hypothetical protein
MNKLVKKLRYLGTHASYEPHMYLIAAERIIVLEFIVFVLTFSLFLAVLIIMKMAGSI